MQKNAFLLLLFFTPLLWKGSTALAQNQRNIDSLQSELKKIVAAKKINSTKANILYEISREYCDNNADTAMYYAKQSLSTSEQAGYKKGTGNAYNVMGGINMYKGNYPPAFDYYQKSLKIYEEFGDKKGIANVYNNLSLIYKLQGNYPEALKHNLASLKLMEEIGDKKGLVMSHINLGSLYGEHGNTQEALKEYLILVPLLKEPGDKDQLGDIYEYIGEFYYRIGNPEALKYYFLSLKIEEEIGNKENMADRYNRIGMTYEWVNNDYPEALKYYLLSLKVKEEIKDDQGMPWIYNCIGGIYEKQENYPEAMKYYRNAQEMSEAPGKDKLQNRFAYANIGSVDYKQENYPEALKYDVIALKKFEEVRDTNKWVEEDINIGNIYLKQRDFPDASKNFLSVLKLAEKFNAAGNAALASIGLGEVNLHEGNLSAALKYENNGLLWAKAAGLAEAITDAYKNLSAINASLKNFQSAYEDNLNYHQWKDSLYKKKHDTKLTQMEMTYKFDKQEDSTHTEQVKKDAVKEKALEDQKRIRNYVLGGLLIVVVLLTFVFRQRNRIAKEKERSEELLLNILPSETAEELKQTGSAKAKSYDMVTVLFTDFKNFTQVSEKMSAEELVNEIHFYYSEFDKIIAKHNIEKIKTIGDSYMCAGGLPMQNKTNPVEVVLAALEIQQFMAREKEERQKINKPFFEIRLGINTGPVVAGIIGIKKFAYDIWGDTVNIASRMESSGEVGKVNISSSTYDLVKDKFTCAHRGKIDAKNKGMIDMYFVEGLS